MQPLPLRALNHVSRVCKDVGASAAWYRDVLGFVNIQRPASFDFDGAWLFNYGIGLHLIGGEPPVRETRINPKADHLSFQADSLDDVEAHLTKLGIDFIKQTLVEAGVVVSQLFFHDLENNMIEVCNCDVLPIVTLPDAPAVMCPTCLTVCPTPSQDSQDSQQGCLSSMDDSSSNCSTDDSMVSRTDTFGTRDGWGAFAAVPFTPHTGLRRSCSLTMLAHRAAALPYDRPSLQFGPAAVGLEHAGSCTLPPRHASNSLKRLTNQ